MRRCVRQRRVYIESTERDRERERERERECVCVCVCVCVHLERRCSAWQHRAERCEDRWPRTCSCRCLRAECLHGTTSSVLRSYIDRRTVRLYSLLVIKNIMQHARRQRKLYNVIRHHRMLGIILCDFFSVTLHRILSPSHWYVILSDSSDIKSRINATNLRFACVETNLKPIEQPSKRPRERTGQTVEYK